MHLRSFSLIALSLMLFTSCNKTVSAFPTMAFETPAGKNVTVHLINHGSLAFDYRGKNIQIDPVGSYGDKTLDYTSFGTADVIFVTHEHGDHFSVQTIESLSDENTRLILNATCAERAGKGEAVKNGDNVAVDSHISAQIVPAYNTTPGRLNFHPRGNGFGVILDFDGLKVYVSGDTEDIPEMAGFGDIDVAFLSTNQPYTMTPEQCVKAAQVIKPKVLIPYHLGNTDTDAIVAGLKDSGIEVRIQDSLR